MIYAKLINKNIRVAPKKLTIGDTQVWNAPAEEYLEQGWKPVTFTQEPDPESGFYFIPGWKETSKKITQTWTKTEAPDEVSDSEALSELLEVIG